MVDYSPITSVYRTQLAPGDNVAAVDLNQEHKTPILIEGVKFSLYSDRVVGTPGAPGYLPAFNEVGTYVDWALQIGSREVRLGDLVPLVATAARKGYADGGSLNGPNSTLPNGTYYEVKFKEPALALPGTRVYALLRYNPLAPLGTGRPVAIDATIEMFGKALPGNRPPPVMTRVPWMQAWRAPAVRLDAASDVDQVSPDSALVNPFGEPIRVTSMLGCLATPLWAGELVPSAKVRVSSSLDGYFVREPTPLMELFNGRAREWGISCAMQSKEYWTVEVTYDASVLLQDETDYSDSDQIQAIFGLMGYRTVPTETLYRDPKAIEAEAAFPGEIRGVQQGRPVR